MEIVQESRVATFCAKAVQLSLSAALLLGCQSGRELRTQLLPVTQLRVPEENQHYRELAWLRPDLLIVNYDTATTTQQDIYQLGVDHPRESGLVAIDIPSDPNPRCFRSQFSDPVRLPDERLGFVRSCPTLSDWRVFLLAWDPNTLETRQLFPYAIPDEGKPITATYAPDLSRGVAGDLTNIEDHLHWLEPEGVRPLDVGMVRANRPQWSPDGHWIAFAGNKGMRGNSGPVWATQPYDLWLMPANCDHEGKPCAESLRRLAQSIEIIGMEWSPDSRRIALGGYPSGQSNGIWVVDVAGGTLTQVAKGDYIMPTWSPGGRQLAVVGPYVEADPYDPSSTSGRKSLHVIDVSALK